MILTYKRERGVARVGKVHRDISESGVINGRLLLLVNMDEEDRSWCWYLDSREEGRHWG